MAEHAPLLLDVTRLVWRRWAGVRPTGIDRICLAWLAHYRSEAQATLVHARGRHILSRSASDALFNLLVEEPDDSTTDGVRSRLLRLALRHATGLVGGAGRGRPWLNIGHTGLDRPGLTAWCGRADLRPVFMVHDLIPITHPQFCRAGEAARHRLRMRTVLEAGHGIIANSRHTLETMAGFAAAEALAMPPALVVWPGTQQLLPPGVSPTATAMPAARFVILGTIEGRKNHLLVLRVWEQLIPRLGAATPQLMIVGRRGWACEEALTMLDSGRFGAHVVESGALDDAEIGELLTGATALLFPSLAEGYGMPLVEALAAGVPVIATDLPVFREIGQGVPELLPADDIHAWATVITDFAASDGITRASQLHRLTDFRAPNWADHFASVDAFLTRLQKGQL